MQLSAATNSGLEKQVKKTNQQPGDTRGKKPRQTENKQTNKKRSSQ